MLLRFIRTLDRGNSLVDIFSRRHHSRDFCAVREEFFRGRLRLVSLLFACLAGLWMLVDYLFLPYQHFTTIAPLMAVLSVLFALIAGTTATRQTAQRQPPRLPLFFALALGFYLIAQFLLPRADIAEAMIVGYYFAPFLLVTLLALFPMTVLESSAYQGSIFITYVIAEFFLWEKGDVVSIGHTWLLAMMAIMVMWAQLSQLQMLLRLYREASYDVLTELVNRRVAIKWLSHEIVEAQQRSTPLSVLLLDLDHFKRINDEHGHMVGDEVLKAFGALLNSSFRSPQIAARFGGEEFFAILPQTTAAEAQALAEQVRRGSHNIRIKTDSGEQVGITVSIGLTTYRHGDTEKSLITRVDDTLYQAKESGRDFVSLG